MENNELNERQEASKLFDVNLNKQNASAVPKPKGLSTPKANNQLSLPEEYNKPHSARWHEKNNLHDLYSKANFGVNYNDLPDVAQADKQNKVDEAVEQHLDKYYDTSKEGKNGIYFGSIKKAFKDEATPFDKKTPENVQNFAKLANVNGFKRKKGNESLTNWLRDKLEAVSLNGYNAKQANNEDMYFQYKEDADNIANALKWLKDYSNYNANRGIGRFFRKK